MIYTTLKRIIKSGLLSAWRERFVSLSAAAIMIITLLVLGSLIFSRQFYQATLLALQDKVDVNVYFLPSAVESDVLSIKKMIESLPEVKSVTYVSREDALKSFEEKHANDTTIAKALEEIDTNPLGATLNIVATDVAQYASLAQFLKSDSVLSKEGVPIIDEINYYQNKQAIDRLTDIVSTSKRIGIAIVVILALFSITITFNTIRMAIYISREEINVMRLVGASSFYIRGPFVVAGVIYGVVSGLITLALFFPIARWLGSEGAALFVNFNAYEYYVQSFFWLALSFIGSGAVLGAISSLLSVQKYLRK